MTDATRDQATTQPTATRSASPADLATIPDADAALEALRLLDDDAPHPLADKLTPLQRQIAEHIVSQRCTAAKAADDLGCARNTVYRVLGKPTVQAYMDALVDVARKALRARSLAVVENALDAGAQEGAAAAHIRAGIEAARFLNGEETRHGATVNVNVVVPGYVIDLTEDRPTLDLTAQSQRIG